MSNQMRNTHHALYNGKGGLSVTKTHVDLIINNASQVLTVRGHTDRPATGLGMGDVGTIPNASIVVKGGVIVSVGKSDEILSKYSGENHFDATGKIVTPGLIDAHTHLVFAGSRENEFELKIKGASYMEILQSGGGIIKTVRDTRAATKKELLRTCKHRALNLLKYGTTSVEAKSGYGLTLPDEVKSLEVVRELNAEVPLTFIPTFLGAHAIPPEFQGHVADYVDELCDEWIPEISKRKLAVFCDVFCEKGVFEISHSRRILEAGKEAGLLPRIHADEFYALGGAELAGELGAVSADHLLQSSFAGLRSMKEAGTIATLQPATPLTLMIEKYPDARRMIDLEIPIALGSDLNPSCWLENHQLIIALACYKLRMSPAEAIVASTINAAHSVRKADEIGSIEPGKKADLAIFDVNDYRFLGYRFGSNMISAVVKNGKVVVNEGELVP
jgi:imidazolonepropionase